MVSPPNPNEFSAYSALFRGQMVHRAASVLAVDSDADAVAHLRESVAEQGLADLFEIVQGEFVSVSERADVVFFEFCLHEMSDACLGQPVIERASGFEGRTGITIPMVYRIALVTAG